MTINCGSETCWQVCYVTHPTCTLSLLPTAQLQTEPFYSERLHRHPRRWIPSHCLFHQQVRKKRSDTDDSFHLLEFFLTLSCCLCRVVKAGTELTWDYSAHRQCVSLQKQEVPCLCGSSACQGQFTIEEKICDLWGLTSSWAPLIRHYEQLDKPVLVFLNERIKHYCIWRSWNTIQSAEMLRHMKKEHVVAAKFILKLHSYICAFS